MAADAWVNVKFDTNIVAETTYGIDILSDSTGFEMQDTGLFKLQGCGHWFFEGFAGTEQVYIRVTINGNELRCAQAEDTRSFFTNDYGTLPYAGTFRSEIGDIVRIQYRVTDTDMNFVGDPVFDNPISFTIFMNKTSN